jgi:hypothetical protein
MPVLLEPVVRYWKCPSCGLIDRTESVTLGDVQMHHCPALGNIALPLSEVSDPDDAPQSRHVLVEREDYGLNPLVGRIASIRTERKDGSNDCTVLAPTAYAQANS